ncbi:type I DNA topoisomerase [Roseospirillum parvum]|uniref:DNA topoisomerase 1 n=1 Tax=Roseospirillum parvum TaxID=83401 RepID=A0A1G7VCL2_9PROT|nr:type I DNA topoisomerase [Roseospirillum parvum]SDG57089.1 DNA topoisomerase-1 [Roseospirillum parvum]
MDVVIVESPAKARTINKYLGTDFSVLASFGHVRDLPARDGSVRPDDGFAMDWEVDQRAEKQLKEIGRALKGARRLYLATDPDREGEAISWHVRDVLAQRGLLKDVEVRRVTFNAITERAVGEAMAQPRDLDQPLIDAYLARRALDYLVGFTLSPVLWRKLPGSRSAGRVQSVALRLICEREAEIERFRSQEYWTVDVDLANQQGQPFTARLSHLEGTKLDKLSLGSAADAERARAAIEAGDFTVAKVARKEARRHPSPPFTTSTLQQEAARKLHFSTTRTMQVAQRLYEGIALDGETVGLITYMRTDGVQIAPEGIARVRELIGRDFAPPFLPDQPRAYKTKAKNAQEAHEAIRPTDVMRRPADVARFLDRDQLRLYELIWKRTVASQMASAVLDQVGVDLADASGATVLRATGSQVRFEGFLAVYREDRDEPTESAPDAEAEGRILPPLDEGQGVATTAIRPEQHFTQPPPRYSEAALVRRMEELGIGRPSTYASILQVLQDRDYVRLDQRRFIPEDRGRLVIAFLESFFKRYVEYNFTADLENQLDEISGGRLDWKTVLGAFWHDFTEAVEGTRNLRVSEVLDALDADLGPHLFPPRADGSDPRACPACGDGRLSLKLGRYGAFIGCSNYPDCRFTQELGASASGEAGGQPAPGEDGPRELGSDPENGEAVTLRKGPYGFYVQRGEGIAADKAKKQKAVKPPRASLPKAMDPASVDLEKALGLLALPRRVGLYPDSGEDILAGIGRFGPYLKVGDTYVSLKGDDDVLTIGENRAVELIAASGKHGKRAPARELGAHPGDGKPVVVKDGRYGPYVEHGRIRATLRKDMERDSVSLEEALPLLAAKAEKAGVKGAGKTASKTSAAKKTTTSKTTATKTTTKKPAAKTASAKKPATKKTTAKKATTRKAPSKAAGDGAES